MSSSKKLDTRDGLKDWLISQLAERLGKAEKDIDTRERFSRFGLKSVMATAMVADLSKALGRKLPPTLVWDYPTIEELVKELFSEDDPTTEPVAASPAGGAVTRSRAPIANEAVAIIGMSCRFPGARSPDEYWRLLKDGVDMIDEVPGDRWNISDYYSDDIGEAGQMTTRFGGFLDQVDQFDPEFFGISPREALQMDPQQRIMLELAWEALEDGGIAPESLKDSYTGVYCGVIWNDYGTLNQRLSTDYVQQHTATGSHYSIVANRISYFLGLRGPSMAIDTACSSSLVAVHLACQSLRSGESTIALAGGVNLILAPDSTVMMSKFGAMSPDGRSKAFDSRANGYVRGEGAGFVALKTLSAALADGDPIYCVIPGSAVNNDGFSNGLTAPSPEAQRLVLQSAYANAGKDTADVHYVETHGTGTPLGDPIEVKALGKILGKSRSSDKPLVIGSVKTNLGHLEGAAGIAGLIKLSLSIKNRAVPPSLHYIKPNPDIPFEDINVRVQSKFGRWPVENETPLAGVSSFGFGGTNCHVVVEGLTQSTSNLMALSAGSPGELKKLAEKVRDIAADAPAELSLPGLCLSIVRKAGAGDHRVAVSAGSFAELAAGMDDYLNEREKPGIAAGTPAVGRKGVVFFFPGQGAQWLGMGLQLMRAEPVFRATLVKCDAAIMDIAGWSLLEELNASQNDSLIFSGKLDVVQPAIWAMEVALADLIMSWGIQPDVVVGHSMGEVAAACIAGILTLEDGARVMCERSRLAETTSGQGGMAIIERTVEEAETLIARFDGRISVASCNSPRSTVLSGDPAALEEIVAELEGQSIFARMVAVKFASHSAQMDPLLDPLFQGLNGLEPGNGRVSMLSTVTGEIVDGRNMGPSYWVRNLRQTVLFSQSISSLISQGYDTFVELSPHPVLSNAVEQCLQAADAEGVVLPSMRRHEDERAVLMDTLGELYVRGETIQWARVYPEAPSVAVPEEFTWDPGLHLEDAGSEDDAGLVVLSARSESALRAAAGNVAAFASRQEQLQVRDLAYTTCLKRNHHDYRLAVAAANRSDLVLQLGAYGRGESAEGIELGTVRGGRKPRMAFVFSGQGPQWWKMGRELLATEPVFRNKLEIVDELFREFAGWSILEQFQVAEGDSRVMETVVGQPAIFALQVALADLWKSWGVEPDGVVGHSVGEVAAAHVAGVLGLEDAVKLIHHRGRWMQEATGLGKMAAVALDAESIEPYLKGFEEKLALGALNAPRSVVLSGEEAALTQVLAKLEKEQIWNKMLPVNYAFHSPQMEPFKHKLMESVRGLSPREATIPMFSTVTAGPAGAWQFEPEYWGRNIREPVRFAPTIQAMAADGYDAFLEISAHPVLANYLAECLEGTDSEAIIASSLNRKKPEKLAMLSSLGRLHARGFPIAWDKLYPDGGRFIRLPAYPWQRKTLWTKFAEKGAQREPAVSGGGSRAKGDGHPLSGRRLNSPLKQVVFESSLSADEPAYLRDHQVQGRVVFPAAGYLEATLAAGRKVLQAEQVAVSDVSFRRALLLSEDPQQLQFIFEPEDGGAWSFSIYTFAEELDWQLNVTGKIRAVAAAADSKLEPVTGKEIDIDEYYANLRGVGLEYGPMFRGIRKLAAENGRSLGDIRLPEDLDTGAYSLHPALLDACFQTFLASLPGELSDLVYLPIALEELQLVRAAGGQVACRVALREGADPGAPVVDMDLLSNEGELVARVSGLAFKGLEREHLAGVFGKEKRTDWFYEIDWKKINRDGRPSEALPGDAWVLLADENGTAEKLAVVLKQKGFKTLLVRRGEGFSAASDDEYQVSPGSLEDMQKLLSDNFGSESANCAGFVHLWNLDYNDTEPELNSLVDAQNVVQGSLLHLVQAVAGHTWKKSPGLTIVSAGGVATSGGEEETRPAQSTSWGLGRTIALEYPEFWGGMIDLDPDSDVERSAKELADLLLTPEDEDHLALRGGKYYAARVEKFASRGDLQEAPIREDGTYLITGGLGGLGLGLAEYLADKGAGSLVLTGRRAPSDVAGEKIKALEEKGVRVSIMQADVSVGEDVDRVFAEIKKDLPTLRGVFHAAGVLDDGVLSQQNMSRFDKVLAPKVQGTWHLHRNTLEQPVEIFAMFSSVVSLLGALAQGNYAAANAFMDLTAHYRRARGLPALSVNWGPWGEVGMAAALENKESLQWTARGMESIPTEAGMDAMFSLIKKDVAQAAVMPVDWSKFISKLPVSKTPPIFSSMAAANTDAEAAKGGAAGGIMKLLSEAPADQHEDVVKGFVQEKIARILQRDPSESMDGQKGFFEMGMDSLMAVELRNQLQGASDEVTLSTTLLFDYPNLNALAKYLVSEVFVVEGGDAADVEVEPVPVAATAVEPTMDEADIEGMSDDDVEAMLLEKLEGMGE